MVATDKLFAGSIPEIYDRYLVPLIFNLMQAISPAGWPKPARKTCWRQRQEQEFSRADGARLPESAHIVATDLNQPMLDYAKARQSGKGRVEWKQADALALPFRDQSFDAVACQFGVMFFPDRIKGF